MSRPEVGSSRIKQLGPVGHGERQGDLGPHAFRELAELAVERHAEAFDERAELVLEAVGVETGRKPADFGGGHPFVERRPLGQVADAAADFEAVAAAVEAQHADFAGGGFGEAEHQADGGRLAGAVFAQQRKHAPRRHGERHGRGPLCGRSVL